MNETSWWRWIIPVLTLVACIFTSLAGEKELTRQQTTVPPNTAGTDQGQTKPKQSTPPQVVKKQVSQDQNPHRLDEIKLNPELTREKVRALWGPPHWYRGPEEDNDMDYEGYRLEKNQELWLAFFSDPPYRLCYASRRSGESTERTVLFSKRDWKPRRLDAIQLTSDLRLKEVRALWGPADFNPGFGMVYEAYNLEDGQQLWLFFGGSLDPLHRLVCASLNPGKGGQFRELFPKPDRKLEPRRLESIAITPELKRNQVWTLWGQAERVYSVGHEYEVYILEDGKWLSLLYYLEPPYLLRGASLYSPSRVEHTLLFPIQERKPPHRDDVKFTPNLTREQVWAGWGPPDRHRGYGMEYEVYGLEDGQELWLLYVVYEETPYRSFGGGRPPYRLWEASLYSSTHREHKSLFRKEIRKVRDRNDIPLSPRLRRDTVYMIWGPPSRHAGSEMEYEVYTLKDGDELWLRYDREPPTRLTGSTFVSPTTEGKGGPEK